MGSFRCALPYGVGESDYIDGQALEDAQLGPAVVYRRARGVCAGAGLRLFESLWFEARASRQPGLWQWYVAFFS